MTVPDFDPKLLIALDALLDAGGVTEAARRLGLSQPAMSGRLARLRHAFDDPLFVVSGRRLVPTDRAEALRDPVRRVLRDMETLVRDSRAFDPRSSRETFRIGGLDYAQAVLSPGLIAQLRAGAPGIRIAVMPFIADATWAALERGDLDAVLVTSLMPMDHAKSRTLFEERFVFVQRRGHPRGATAPDADAFCALDHVLVSPGGGGFRGQVDRVLEQSGRSRNVVVSVPGFALAPRLVAGSDLVAVLPERLARRDAAELDIFPLPVPVDGFALRLLWHPRRDADPAHRWLRRKIADHVGAEEK